MFISRASAAQFKFPIIVVLLTQSHLVSTRSSLAAKANHQTTVYNGGIQMKATWMVTEMVDASLATMVMEVVVSLATVLEVMDRIYGYTRADQVMVMSLLGEIAMSMMSMMP